MKVLIADDSALLRKSINKLLSLIDDLELIESHSVLSTINQIEVESPDAIILDLQLPDGTGLNVLQYLKVKEKNLMTIVLTNFANENNRHRCMKSGADYFFDKTNEFKRVIPLLEKSRGE